MKMRKERKELIAIRVDSDVVQWLKRAARNRRVTLTHLVREQLYRGFDQRRK
jgi:hypothetical protein